jgi:hypothetical protein
MVHYSAAQPDACSLLWPAPGVVINVSAHASMSEWEYTTINLSNLLSALEVLNDAAKDGWELVAITGNNLAYLKREVAKATPTTTRSGSRSTAK